MSQKIGVLMSSIEEIASSLSYHLAISEAEAFEVVRSEDVVSLQTNQFLLVGRLLTNKAFHKDAILGTMRNI